MDVSAYYQRAKTDREFRRSELGNLRYYRSVGAVLIGVFALLGIATTLYGGLSGHDRIDGLGAWSDMAVVTLVRAWCTRRIARLEEFEAETE